MAEQTCAVCGRGGFWVGYYSNAGEDRCVNHMKGGRLKPYDADPVLPNSGDTSE